MHIKKTEKPKPENNSLFGNWSLSIWNSPVLKRRESIQSHRCKRSFFLSSHVFGEKRRRITLPETFSVDHHVFRLPRRCTGLLRLRWNRWKIRRHEQQPSISVQVSDARNSRRPIFSDRSTPAWFDRKTVAGGVSGPASATATATATAATATRFRASSPVREAEDVPACFSNISSFTGGLFSLHLAGVSVGFSGKVWIASSSTATTATHRAW